MNQYSPRVGPLKGEPNTARQILKCKQCYRLMHVHHFNVKFPYAKAKRGLMQYIFLYVSCQFRLGQKLVLNFNIGHVTMSNPRVNNPIL